MFRFLLILVVGIAIGYFIGFGDGQTNDKNVVVRTIDRVGGTARDRVGNDIDSKYDKVGR
jgi:hypothetical protein